MSPWCSPVTLKFGSYNLQHCKKNCRKLNFQVFPEQLFYHIIFGRLHCYVVTLVKNIINHYYKKVKQKFSTKKDLYLFKVNEKSNSGVLRINQLMSKLLTISKRSRLNCQQIQQLLSLLHYIMNMPCIFTFHILHTT